MTFIMMNCSKALTVFPRRSDVIKVVVSNSRMRAWGFLSTWGLSPQHNTHTHIYWDKEDVSSFFFPHAFADDDIWAQLKQLVASAKAFPAEHTVLDSLFSTSRSFDFARAQQINKDLPWVVFPYSVVCCVLPCSLYFGLWFWVVSQGAVLTVLVLQRKCHA